MYNANQPAEFIAKDVIKAIIAETITPDLKAAGYRKQAFTWRKQVEDVVKIVNVQLSRWNQSHESAFTINLGIYHELFHAERGMSPIGKSVNEPDCDVRERIGRLMGKVDYWWTVAHNKDNHKVKEGVRYNFVNHALPWIEGFGSLPEMYDWFIQNGDWFGAAVAALLLKRDNVEELTRKTLATANSHFASNVRRWANKHGLDV